jgi:hypothetical protein
LSICSSSRSALREVILSGSRAAPIQGTLQRSLEVIGPAFLVTNEARRFFDPAWNEDEPQ